MPGFRPTVWLSPVSSAVIYLCIKVEDCSIRLEVPTNNNNNNFRDKQ